MDALATSNFYILHTAKAKICERKNLRVCNSDLIDRNKNARRKSGQLLTPKGECFFVLQFKNTTSKQHLQVKPNICFSCCFSSEKVERR